ncbi:MAG: bifunctional nuclease family protein [Opitutales bacterium]|jgi:bifunctional DNase/RNase
MKPNIVPISIKAIIPTTNGSAVFLTERQKMFVLYVDKEMGETMQMAIDDVVHERPLSHNLITHMLDGLGAEVERVIINDVVNGTYFARLIISMENELGHKIVEIDSRPSDSIILALLSDKPIYASDTVINKVEDMSEIYQKIIDVKP